MSLQQIIAIVIFLCTMGAIITGKVHNTVASLTGAACLVLTHILSIEDCIDAVDVETICILVGMMLLVAVIKNSGIFEYIAIKAAKIAKGRPWPIMVIFILITAVCSGMLDNVTTVLLVGPMTLAITNILKVDPVPYIITQIMASNIGGTATLIGDPPNIMIGSATGLTFFDFLMYDGPAVLLILIAAMICFYFIYGRKMGVAEDKQASIMTLHAHEAIKSKSLFTKSVIMTAITAVAFVLHGAVHIEPSVVALGAAAIMLILSRAEVEEVLMDVEWSTIGFFAGLFVVVGGLAETGVIEMLANALIDATGGDLFLTIMIMVWASAIISSFLDNIPMVATLIPIILAIGNTGVDIMPYWWAISLGACIGGIGTQIGASANVVLSGMSKTYGYPITFMEYTKVGFPVMLVFTAISCVYLVLRFCVFV